MGRLIKIILKKRKGPHSNVLGKGENMKQEFEKMFRGFSKAEAIIYLIVSGLIGIYLYRVSGMWARTDNLFYEIGYPLEFILGGQLLCYLPYRLVSLKKWHKWWHLPLLIAVMIPFTHLCWYVNGLDNYVWSVKAFTIMMTMVASLFTFVIEVMLVPDDIK